MKKFDVAVIGGGLAGYFAAAKCAELGQKTVLLSFGKGSLIQASGAIDFYKTSGAPIDAIKNLPGYHPYKKIGLNNIDAAKNFFLELTKNFDLPYSGNLDRQILIPTAAGTFKKSALVPDSMNGDFIKSAKKFLVIGISGVKDFFAEPAAENFKKFFPDKDFQAAEIDIGIFGGRNKICLDAAKFLDTAEGRNIFVDAAKKANPNGAALIIPPILGTEGGAIFREVRERLGVEILETTCLPPSPAGIRLRKVFEKYLREKGVRIVEHIKVVRADSEPQKVLSIVAQTASREKIYFAEKFILATGGFYGGGITLREFEKPRETVFDLPVYFPSGEENWSNEKLFSDSPHGFALTGIITDTMMRPVDESVEKVFDNVRAAGGVLGGFDSHFEHSSGGVAISSAYAAAVN